MNPRSAESLATRSGGPFATHASGADHAHPDLHSLVHGGRALDGRDAPARTLELARSLCERVASSDNLPSRLADSVEERILTAEVLRDEAARDQNVYLSGLFTERLTRALPDLLFLPGHTIEVAAALRWAAETGVPVTVRGAASGALGGAVPNDAGLTLDLSRLDHIDIDGHGEVCVVGGGARMRDIHAALAERDLALPVYSSNLGGTFAGWLVSGGLGLNGFGPRRACDVVRAVDVVLPSGDLVRLHKDGRLDVSGERSEKGHRELPADQVETWFAGRGMPPFGLADLAGSEGTFGVVTQVVITVGRRPEIGAFLLGFENESDACSAALAVAGQAGGQLPRPVNLKLTDGAFVRHQRAVWADDDRRPWRRLPSALSDDEQMPWTRIAGPVELGLGAPSGAASPDATGAPSGAGPAGAAAAPAAHGHDGAFLYVDFLDLEAARRFAAAVPGLPGAPVALDAESVRFAAERFRPQQSKRLGPGLLAAEIELPADGVAGFLKAARKLARGAGVALDPEVYFLSSSDALVIAGYLVDHRRASFLSDLALAPALLDLAVRRFGGRPYVLGRWQSFFAAERFGRDGLERRRAIKQALDPGAFVNRGVVYEPCLRGGLGRLVTRAYRPGVRVARRTWSTPVARGLARVARACLAPFAGPGHRGGRPLTPGDLALPAAERALHCVNCGECNAVCPVFHSALIRLPQTLTHLGESVQRGRRAPAAADALLDCCVACGDCEEVCQAGIPHLDLYQSIRARLGDGGAHARERQVAVLTALRGSARYRDDFLRVRPGQYERRAPAALSGTVRYLVMRAESAEGPAATCLHCAACVPVCPTDANKEYASDGDARLVTTDEHACVGCGTCVEVCPGNRLNGGQTLRVVEVPGPLWLEALAEFEGAVHEEAR